MNDIPPDGRPTRDNVRSLKSCETLAQAMQTKEFMDRIRQSVPRHMSPDRMLRTCIQAVSKTPDLTKCNMRSVIGAMLTLSQLGFEPNSALGHAYLIPFKTRKLNKQTKKWEDDGYDVQVILGYQGLLDLSYRSAQLSSIHCDVVWKADEFSFEYGTDAHLRHRPKGIRADTEAPLYAYMHAKLKDGQAFEVMPYSEVIRIRNGSQAYQAALRAKDGAEKEHKPPPKSWTEAPWVRHEIAMARKTALRQGSRWLPRSVELASALALDEVADRKAIDYGQVYDAATLDQETDYLGVATDAAEIGGDPGTAHGVRATPQNEPPPAADRPHSAAPPVSTPEPVRQAAPASAQPEAVEEGFRAFLVDEHGEVIGEEWTDPLGYIQALISLVDLRGRYSEAGQAIREFAEGSIADACEAHIRAQAEYDEWGSDTMLPAAEAQTEPFPPLAVGTIRGGKPDWNGYQKALRAVLYEIASPARLLAALEHYRPTMLTAPAGARLNFLRDISTRMRALEAGPPPAWVADMAKPEPKPDPAAPAQESLPMVAQPWPGASDKTPQEWVAACRTWLDVLGIPEYLSRFVADGDNGRRRQILAEQYPQDADLLSEAILAASQRLGVTLPLVG